MTNLKIESLADRGAQVRSAAGTRAARSFRYVWAISLVAALGGLLFGYDWVVIGGAKPFLEKYFSLTSAATSGWANSCAILGCLLGSVVAGGLSDKFGRKRLLMAAAILFAASSLLTGWASTFDWFVTWRIVGGVAIGMASNLSPVYIAEVAPAQLRGRLVAVYQLTVGIGVVLAQLVNWMIAEKMADEATAEAIRLSWNGQYGWRWMFTAVAVPSVIFLVGLFWVPESPRWLVKNGQSASARNILTRIGGEAHANGELHEIQATLAREERQKVNFRDLMEPRLLRILLIGVGLAVLQQWSGINVIFNYAEEIFRAAGYGSSTVLSNIIGTGAVAALFTILAVATIDRFGRRGLMLIGCSGICCFHLLIGFAYQYHLKGPIVVIPVLASIACYDLSLAPVTWVLISEIFPNRIRGAAVSVAVSALWIACFILTYTFPLLNSALGAAKTFWLYALICGLGAVFIYLKVPETKGKSLEEIEIDLLG